MINKSPCILPTYAALNRIIYYRRYTAISADPVATADRKNFFSRTLPYDGRRVIRIIYTFIIQNSILLTHTHKYIIIIIIIYTGTYNIMCVGAIGSKVCHSPTSRGRLVFVGGRSTRWYFTLDHTTTIYPSYVRTIAIRVCVREVYIRIDVRIFTDSPSPPPVIYQARVHTH